MTMVKKNWADISSDPISEEAVRALHQPHKQFKIYINKTEPGKSLPTNAAHEFILYVLSGSCKTCMGGIDLTLTTSQFITLEKGSYEFEAMGDEELTLLKVFSLA